MIDNMIGLGFVVLLFSITVLMIALTVGVVVNIL